MFLSVGFVLISVYIVIFLYFLLASDAALFQPQSSSYGQDSQFVKLPINDRDFIMMRHLVHPEAKYTILYSHGNAEDVGQLDFVVNAFYAHQFSVLMYDYSGYGLSSGRPSEKKVYDNIQTVYHYLVDTLNVPPGQILVYGRSVGGGPSVHLAAHQPVGGLILESAFTSAYRVMTHIPIFPMDKFNNLRKIGSVECPVLVIHGKQDRTIPFWHGKALYDRANSPKMHFWLENARHNDVIWVAGAKYWETIEEFFGLVENK